MKPIGHSTATKTGNRKRNLIQSIHSKKWKFQKCYVWYNPESEKYLSSVVQSLPQNLYDNVFPTYVVISFSTFSHSLWTNWCQIVMNRYSLPRSNNPLLYWRIQAIVKLYNVHFNGVLGNLCSHISWLIWLPASSPASQCCEWQGNVNLKDVCLEDLLKCVFWGIPDISRWRHLRRQCKICQVRGIFPYWTRKGPLCNLVHSV